MFSSISSCVPSSVVSTSFTAKESQTLVINQSVRVISANVYYVDHTASIFNFYIDATSVTPYINPEFYFVTGRTYQFAIKNLIDEAFYITNTSGIEYTNGVRYYEYRLSRETKVWPGGPIVTQVVGATPLATITIPGVPASVWLQPSGSAVKSLLLIGTNYSMGIGATNVTYNFVTPVSNCTLYFVQGWGSYLITRRGKHHNNTRHTIGSSTLTPGVDYVMIGGYIYYFGVWSAGLIADLDDQGGMEGFVSLTMTASTPATLQIRNRKTKQIQATIRVTPNGTIFPVNSLVSLKENDTVFCSVVAPATYLSYNYYQYLLDGQQNYFAVVTKNNYTPVVKVADRLKRYFNYVNYYSSISLADVSTNTILYVGPSGLGHGSVKPENETVNFNNYHVILDVQNYKVNLYTGQGGLRFTVKLPDFPISYFKFNYTLAGTIITDLGVLAADGKVYRIKPDLTYTSTSAFTPATLSLAFINANLPINEDIPFLGSFSDAARAKLVASLFPIVVSCSVKESSSEVYLAGSTQIARVNLNTGILFGTISLAAIGRLASVTFFDINGVIVTTDSHRIYYVQNSGAYLDLTPPGALVLGSPDNMVFNRAGRVAIPDCHNKRLIVINGVSTSNITYVNLGDFVPAYVKRFDNSILVTGHDTNRVIDIEVLDIYDYVITENSPAIKIRYVDFTKKVTLASKIGSSIIAHHFLDNRTTLDLIGSNIKKVIPYNLDYREGPVNSIGTTPKIFRLLGDPSVTPIAGPYIKWWVNGELGANLVDDSYLGVNYRAPSAGYHRSFIILGEHALDYDTLAITDSSYLDHYLAGAYNTLVTTFVPGTVYVPPVFAGGTYTLPFDINYFGNNYTEFLFSARHGVLGFDTAFPLGSTTPNFTAMATDALLVEPRTMYIDYHIDNRIVAAVTWAPTFLGIVPGVFYTQGIIGEFKYYHWKVVGTDPTPNPNGLVRNTETIAQNGTFINMVDFSSILVGDYASNPIAGTPPYAAIVSTGPVVGTPSNQVLSILPYLFNPQAYLSIGNKIYVTIPGASYLQYAKVTPTGSTTLIGWIAGVNTDTYLTGNPVIEVLGNKITEEGLVNLALVNSTEYIFEYTTVLVSTTYERGLLNNFSTVVASSTTSTVTDIITAVNIQHVSSAFSPVGARIDQFIEVSLSVYNNLVVGQKLNSTLFGPPETIISKVKLPQTFNLNVSPQLAWEGIPPTYPPSTISIDFTTINVPDGNAYKFDITGGPFTPQVNVGQDFGPLWTVEWPTTALPPAVIANGTSVNLTIYGNHIRIKIPVVSDVIPYSAEKLESWNVKVTNLTGPAIFIELGNTTLKKLLIGNTLSNTGTSAGGVTNFIYLIEVGAAYTSSTADIISGDKSVFTFSSVPAAIKKQTVQNPINYVLPQPPPPAPPIDDPFDTLTIDVYSVTLVRYKTHTFETLSGITPPISTLTTLDVKGNFLEFSAAQVLPASTPILFKTYTVPSMIEFDVGFWRGRGFQYIEFNYPRSTFHDNSLTIGLRNANNTYNYQIAGTPPVPQVSYLFGGNYSDGILYNLGLGRFNYLPSGGFVARKPRIYKERSVDETAVKYDIYIDQKIPAAVDVRASVDYGVLRLNDGLYDGTKKINEGDVLTLIVPFKTNLVRSAVILGLGKNQFAIPVTPESQINAINNLVFFAGIQPTITNQNVSYVVAVTGNYFVPDYFSDATGGGSETSFSLWDPTGAIKYFDILRGSYFAAGAGDLVKIDNIFTGYRQYNTIEIVLAGSNDFVKIQIETVGKPPIINYLNFGLLNDPYTQLNRQANLVLEPTSTKIEFLPIGSGPDIPQYLLGTVFNETFDGRSLQSVPYYETKNFYNVTSPLLPPGTPITLFSDQINVTFVTQSMGTTTRTSEFYSVVPTDTYLGLEWDVWSYHADNSKIYQITLDPLDNSEVYTEVGSWTIRNKQMTPILVNGIANSGKSVASITVLVAGLGYNRNAITLVIDPPPPPGITAEGFVILDLLGTGTVVSVNLTSGGSGYITPPAVSIVGPFILPAILQATLATETLPHETEIKIATNYEDLQFTELANSMPSYKIVPPETETKIPLLQNLIPVETNILDKILPYKHIIEYSYITTPQPLYGVFSSPRLYTSELLYKHGPVPSFFTKSTDNEVQKFGLFSKLLTYGPIIRANPVIIQMENLDKVLPQVTSVKIKMGNYERSLPVKFFTSQNNYNFLTFIPNKLKPPSPFIDFPFTIFSKNNSFVFDKQVTLLKTEPSEQQLQPHPTVLESIIESQDKPGNQTLLFSDPGINDMFFINELFSDPVDFDLVYISQLFSDPINGEFQNTQDYYKAMGYEFETHTVLNPPGAEEEFVNFTVLTPKTADPTISIFTVLESDAAQSNLFLTNLFTLPINGEYEQLTLLNSDPAVSERSFYPTMLFEFKEAEFDPLYLHLFDIDPEFVKQDKILPPIDPEWLYQDKLFQELPPEWLYQDKLFHELPPEWLYQDKLFPELQPEWLYQDKLFPELPPEWLYQDKLFPELPPEWLYQDKLFIDLTPDQPDPGNRYIEFLPELGYPGNRYIEFLPELGYPGNRYIEFLSELGYPGNRYIEFLSELEPPANKYIDIIPKLIGDLSPLINLPPELYIPDNNYLPLTPYRLTEEKLFLDFPPKLDQLNVQYQDGFNLYGAFKTEFLIFADHGRAGDLGQYQGTPPGTPGRTNIPILSYREFMGSALLKYTPTYGFGGFSSQPGAQAIADKYVNATAIRVQIAGFWNYRIHFDKKVFRPRKSRVFPTLWYVRGA